MRKFAAYAAVAALVISGIAGWYLSQTGSPGRSVQLLRIGDKAPDFELQNSKGETVVLSELRGKVVLVNFWATWCPPCRAEIPSMDELYQSYAEGNFEILAINIEANGPEIMPGFSREFPHSFPVLFDTDGVVQERYGVYKFPETFVLDKDGIIVEKVVGAIDWTAPNVLSFINSKMQE